MNINAESAGAISGALQTLWKECEVAMKLNPIIRLARPLLVTAGMALFVDLFLDWREVSIRAGGFSLHVGSSAWSSGWGIAAGIVAIVVIVVELPLLAAGRTTSTPARAGLLTSLAAALLVFTVAAFATASVDVSAPSTAVQVGGRLWPAYAGLVLAALVAVGAFLQLLSQFVETEDWPRSEEAAAPQVH